MSDTIVVMNKGVIQQIGTPEDIYNEPKNKFVAKFIGASNIVAGKMLEDFKVEFYDVLFTCVDKGFCNDENVDVVIRPEDIKIVPYTEGMLSGTVTSVTFKGVHYEIEVDINNTKWLIHNIKKVNVGEKIGIEILPDDIHIMRKASDEL